ncbi:hypothetical protein GCM10011610_22860 [Nocardia rhizosphaerihabitans]|uniref:Uncharacterized protein n=1 Tax=Nocardia rhizosphaerihabitans TaxID=1691570 RepID=A0ABQ2KB01_9NOCA|nr:hypothetical protein GCM10011610_22860 [Nocardia rhizosphaerihabitans]
MTEYGNDAHIWLAAAGDGLSDTFAVCGAEGRAIWYGPFLDADVDHPHGDRAAAAMSAAGRAIWLAGRAREDAGAGKATLHLSVSDDELDAVTLACTASMAGLALDLVVTDDNPALDWCHAFGRLDWTPGQLGDLVDPTESHGTPALRSITGGLDPQTEPQERPVMHDNALDPWTELRSALEGLLLHDAIGMDAKMRHAVAAVVHLTVDTPHGPPEDAEEFLGRFDASWLVASWLGHDTELSLIATLAAGEIPALSWCELMFTTTLAPWSTSPVAAHARRVFTTVQRGKLGAVRAHVS